MNTYSRLFLVLISIIILSCSSDDDSSGPVIPDGDYANGTLILNEGGSAGGSVSFLSADLQQLENSIFEEANAGEGLGLFLQSIFFHDDKAFIISNGSNRITVVNRYTFEHLGTVDSGLSVPRYGTVHNGKAYVTNQADFTSDQDDYLAIIDLETLEVEETVIVGAVAEEIVNYNGDLYILNSAFGEGSGISRFSTESNTIASSISGDRPFDSMRLYDGMLYIASGRFIETYDVQSSSWNVTISENPAGLDNISNLRVSDDRIYFTSGSAVYSSPVDFTADSAEMILDYGGDSDFGVFYGFEVNEGKIYIGDAGAFVNNGTVYIYSVEGQRLDEITVGNIGPNSFYFQ